MVALLEIEREVEGKQMSRQIIIQVRNVYGNEMVYPVCENAKRFAAIANKKTFSPFDLGQIVALGFEIRQAPTQAQVSTFKRYSA
jgi:hypothetical protein